MRNRFIHYALVLLFLVTAICPGTVTAEHERQVSTYLKDFSVEKLKEINQNINRITNVENIIDNIDRLGIVTEEMDNNPTEETVANTTLAIGETFEAIREYYDGLNKAKSIPIDLREFSHNLKSRALEYKSKEGNMNYGMISSFFEQQGREVEELANAFDDVQKTMEGFKSDLQALAEVYSNSAKIRQKIGVAFSGSGNPKEIMAKHKRLVRKLHDFKVMLKNAIQKVMSIGIEDYSEEYQGFKKAAEDFHRS